MSRSPIYSTEKRREHNKHHEEIDNRTKEHVDRLGKVTLMVLKLEINDNNTVEGNKSGNDVKHLHGYIEKGLNEGHHLNQRLRAAPILHGANISTHG